VERGAAAVVPESEEHLFTAAEETWREMYRSRRFHDYECQVSKMPADPVKVGRKVRDGDRIEWGGPVIEVLGTPGYTRGAVSYLFKAGRKRIACSGDLIYAGGKILDLYSLQDAIPELKVRGYHGFAARISQTIGSLRRVAAWKPDLIVPARGPLFEDPLQAIAKLIERLQRVYANYLYTDAYHWYSGDQVFAGRALRVLGTAVAEALPRAVVINPQPPAWVRTSGNSRLVVSASGEALLVDCGFARVLEQLRKWRDEGVFRKLAGIYITHYHDDHTDFAQAAADEFACDISSCPSQREILTQPERFRMPCLSPNAIRRWSGMKDGVPRRWNEFRLTSWSFPGQTLYHGAVLVEKDSGERIFFVGDSFTPTGIDDYCLLNRNFVARKQGFLRCLELIGSTPDCLLINQHVVQTFRFSRDQVDAMKKSLERRAALLNDLFPWDSPGYGLDEQWARLDPYAIEARRGGEFSLRAVFFNHSATVQTYEVTLHLPSGWQADRAHVAVKVPPGEEGYGRFRVRIRSGAQGVHVLTADVRFGNWDLRRWSEALVAVS
jgi:glyoxylase-like metal-dependent hydrolase (beta-lactamase superfamily II)